MLSIVMALLLMLSLPVGAAAQSETKRKDGAAFTQQDVQGADPQAGEEASNQLPGGAAGTARGDETPDASPPGSEEADPASGGEVGPSEGEEDDPELSRGGQRAAALLASPMSVAEGAVGSIGEEIFITGSGGTVYPAECGAGYYSSSVYFPLLTASDEPVNSYDAVSQAVVLCDPSVAQPGFHAGVVKKKHAQEGGWAYSYFVEVRFIEPGVSSVELATTLSVVKETGESYDFSVERTIGVVFRYPTVEAQGEPMAIQTYPQVFDVSSAGGPVAFLAGDTGAAFEVGAAGQPAVVLQFDTAFHSEVAALYPYANLDFYNFREAHFENEGTLRLPAREGSWLYRLVDPSTGKLEPLQGSCSYENGQFVLPTDSLQIFAVSDTELTEFEPPETPQSIARIGGGYYAADAQGVVRASTQNTTGLTGDGPLFVPLYDGGDNLIVQSRAVRSVTVDGVYAGGYVYKLRLSAMPTDFAGDVQEAYFVELRSMDDDGRPIAGTRTPFFQDTFTAEIFLERSASVGLGALDLSQTVAVTAGYPVAPFAVTQAAQTFDARDLAGQCAIVLDASGRSALILADLTDVDSVSLAYDQTEKTVDAADLPSGLRFHNVTAEFAGEGAQPVFCIEGSWGEYVYRLDGAAPVEVRCTENEHRGFLCPEGEIQGSTVVSPRILAAVAEPKPGRVAGAGDWYRADRQEVVRKERKLSAWSSVTPGRAYYRPLLTAEDGPVVQPDAASDIGLELRYLVGHDGVESVSVAQRKSDLFSSGGTAESYFLKIVMRENPQDICADRDVIWELWMKKYSPPGYSFGFCCDMAVVVGYPRAQDWEITREARVFDFAGQTERSLTFAESAGLIFTANMAGQGKLLIQADAQPDAAIQAKFPFASLTFVNGYEAQFNKYGTLCFPASYGGYHYLVGSDGGLSRLSTTYNSVARTYTLKTRTLERYVVSSIDLIPPSSPGGGGGSKGGGGSAAILPSVPATQPLTAEQAASAFDAALTKARAAGALTAAVQLINKDTLPLEVVQGLLQNGRAAGVSTVIYADYVVDNAIAVRFYLNPAALNKTVSVAARLDDAAVAPAKNVFTRFFKNKMAFIQFGQAGSYGTAVAIAAKVDLAGMDTAMLRFYHYDAATNVYDAVASPNAWVDATGFLHFSTPKGGFIVISQGPLERKA